ncbi:response regulator transcription factor [Pectobacterium brasiliense]|uniref:response regulator transcription factor n=1 Tax=Pectobacterium brasiliense TaxID=180957 RepID=UPI001968B2DE|nr:response regulator transcription factor [Pectobacterium brasiliense]MBN3199772.1 response regulator transcription factor [Pectobacterium brasiliense]
MAEKRVLVIEDDMDAASVLEAYLRRDGYQVSIASDGQKGLHMALTSKPDLILLDVMLPKMNGSEVLSALRQRSNIPVIMVTAIGDEPERIGALRYGADDYVVKPYNPQEVVARVQAVLRRTGYAIREEAILTFENLSVDLTSVTASIALSPSESVVLDLTPTEFNILVTLLKAPNRAFTRGELLEASLPESDALERVVDTHVHNLRKKLNQYDIINVLVTVRSVGYRFR